MRIVREGTGTHTVTLYDFEPTPDRICEDVARGLSSRPKKLPPKYFYDERGARLFERITELEAYYPTRTEISILRNYASEIADRVGSNVRLLEFGSGSGDKTWIILEHLKEPAAYIPVDISRAQLVEFALEVARAFPDLEVVPVCADYTAEFSLPASSTPGTRCIAFFPGSTLGNFEPSDAERFLSQIRTVVGPNGGFLLGIDLRKHPSIIERAYNDPEGLTAEFNLNLLERINRECGAGFEISRFHHHALFDPAQSRVEMRLVSEVAQTVRLRADPADGGTVEILFDEAEPIITEYSHKFDLDEFGELARKTGWTVEARWLDDRRWFAVLLLG